MLQRAQQIEEHRAIRSRLCDPHCKLAFFSVLALELQVHQRRAFS